MPAVTPTGIVYPCSGETIDCEVFADNAESIQEALDNTQANVDTVLHPPSVWLRRPFQTAQVYAPGVTLILSYDQIMYDTAAMFSLVAPTLITITSPGTYLVNLDSQLASFPTTMTSFRAAILVNGSEVAFYKSDAGTSTNLSSEPMFVSAMPISLVPGDVITATNLVTGTGAGSVNHAISVMRVSTT